MAHVRGFPQHSLSARDNRHVFTGVEFVQNLKLSRLWLIAACSALWRCVILWIRNDVSGNTLNPYVVKKKRLYGEAAKA
jgi:hypothetical protein